MDIKHAELNLNAFGAALTGFHVDYDLIITATLAMKPFPAGISSPPNREPDVPGWTATLYPFNWSRQPAITVPCGLTADNLPGRIANRRGPAGRWLGAARRPRL